MGGGNLKTKQKMEKTVKTLEQGEGEGERRGLEGSVRQTTHKHKHKNAVEEQNNVNLYRRRREEVE